MKAFANYTLRLIGLASSTLLALTAPAARAVIVPVTPVGQWDCTMDGPGQTGIIFLKFTDDVDTNSGFRTFEGFFAQAGHRGTSPDASSRSEGGGSSRNDSSGNSSGNSVTNLFGGGFINGSSGPVADNGGANDWLIDSREHRGNWFYNSKGQVVGSFYTTLNATGTITNYFESCYSTNFSVHLTNGSFQSFPFSVCATNAILTTNVAWTGFDGETGTTNLTFINTNFTLGFIATTNNVSFVGKVVFGKRLTLTGMSSFGKITIRGVPLAPIAIPSNVPLDGAYFWTGTKKQNGNKSAEIFKLTPTIILNAYGMNGQGPTYSYNENSSFCLISANKRIGFVVSEIGIHAAPDTLHMSRASVGKFTNTRNAIGAKTIGDSVDNTALIGFDAFLTPFIP